jgi:hypothetical protein
MLDKSPLTHPAAPSRQPAPVSTNADQHRRTKDQLNGHAHDYDQEGDGRVSLYAGFCRTASDNVGGALPVRLSVARPCRRSSRPATGMEQVWGPPRPARTTAADHRRLPLAAQIPQEGVPGDHILYGLIRLQAAHRSQPALELPVIGLDRIIGVLLGGAPAAEGWFRVVGPEALPAGGVVFAFLVRPAHLRRRQCHGCDMRRRCAAVGRRRTISEAPVPGISVHALRPAWTLTPTGR